jgi:CHAT domain-containing protein/tetratricopeptide (TPR) repeat protein
MPAGLARIAPFVLLAASCVPDRAGAARAVPDSLDAVVASIDAGRAADPATPALAERVLERRERAHGPRDRRVAEALGVLGRVRLARAEYPAADSILERALAQHRSARPRDLHAIAVALGWSAEAQRVNRRLARAESTATEALSTLVQSGARDTATEVRLRTTLGDALAERGRLERARDELTRAVALAGAMARPDSAQLARTSRNLARAFVLLGSIPEARAGLDRAAAIQERTLGPDHPELALTHHIGTFLEADAGDYVAQRRHAERALAIRERAFGNDHMVVAASHMALGGAMANFGDQAGALAHYERAVAILRPLATAAPADLAVSLNNLANARLRLGDGRRARQLFEEARAVREKAFGPGGGGSFWNRVRLAEAMLVDRDTTAARAQIDSTFASPVRRNPFDLADGLRVRGMIAYVSGRRAAALDDYDRAHALYDSALGAGSHRTLEALALRAAAGAVLGHRDRAWHDARRAEAGSREVLRATARAMSEHEALGFERIRAAGLEVLLSLATDSIGAGEAARAELADAAIRGRLVVLDELADERRALLHADPALVPALRTLEDARAALARGLVEALRRGRSPDSSVARARERRDAAERGLAEASAPYRAGFRRSTAGFDEVAGALPAGSALVSYVRYRPPEEHILASAYRAPVDSAPARYAALVLRAGERAPEVVTLGPGGAIEAAVERWVEACATPPPSDPRLARAAARRCDALGRVVRARAWDPVARACGGAGRVFVVPDGVLHAVNLPALPTDDGAPLVEAGPTFHRLAAERDLVPWDPGARPSVGLLALGGPDFDHPEDAPGPLIAAAPDVPAPVRTANAGAPRLRFDPLPHTEAEVRDIVALWRRAAGAGDAIERLGPAATEAAFKRLAPGRRVLHVATHGFALGADPGPPAPAAGTRAVGAVVSGTAAPVRRGAALLPGLALAGANQAPAPGGEDGFLTAEEITALDLTGVEWAVLSACETGLAEPDAVEAVQGLQRAFRRAGLRTAIVSLWAVDDEATRAWMTRLYTARLLEWRDTAESVRAASRGLLRDRRARGLDTHPFHWAAFVAQGDWR